MQAVVTGMLGLAALAASLLGLCAALLISVAFGAPAERDPRTLDAAVPRGFEGENQAM